MGTGEKVEGGGDEVLVRKGREWNDRHIMGLGVLQEKYTHQLANHKWTTCKSTTIFEIQLQCIISAPISQYQ